MSEQTLKERQLQSLLDEQLANVESLERQLADVRSSLSARTADRDGAYDAATHLRGLLLQASNDRIEALANLERLKAERDGLKKLAKGATVNRSSDYGIGWNNALYMILEAIEKPALIPQGAEREPDREEG